MIMRKSCFLKCLRIKLRGWFRQDLARCRGVSREIERVENMILKIAKIAKPKRLYGSQTLF
jgi:hypothetical protein